MTPFLAWLEEYLQKFLTQRIMILSLEILTQRIDYCEQKYDSKNWTFESVTQSTEPSFSIWVNESNPLFQYGLLKEFNPWTFFFFKNEYDSKNWTYFTFKELSLKELNLLFHDSKNWTLFEETQWIEYFLWSKELYFLCWMWSKELNLFCWMWPKELNHCWKTWRIDPFYKYDWELNPFWTFSYDSKKWTFFDMTQRIKLFCMWLKELKFLYKKWVQEWIFRMWLKELKFFNMTQRIEIDAQNWTSLFSNMTHRIEHLFSRIWRTELNISFLEYDAQNWTSLFSNMTHRIEHPISSRIWLTEFFLIWLTELNSFFSKWLIELNIFFSKWLKGLIFSKVTQRIELIFWKYNPQDWTFSLIWPKERIEILWYDTKDWIFLIWLTEPNTFFNITQRIEPFSPIDSKNWTFFFKWLKEVNFLFDKIWPKGLIFSDMTQRTENFFECDSKNWTFFF